jgi:hypothetical protein
MVDTWSETGTTTTNTILFKYGNGKTVKIGWGICAKFDSISITAIFKK